MRKGRRNPQGLLTMQASDLFAQWRHLCDSGLNNRAAAGRLGVSEAKLVASGCGTISKRLLPDARAILEAARRLGAAKFVVRNDFAVLERAGAISRISVRQDPLEVRAASLQLQIAPGKVAAAFALLEPREQGTKRSLQLFDAAGVTVLKLVFREQSDDDFNRVVNPLLHSSQTVDETVDPEPRPARAEPAPRPRAALGEFLQCAARLGVPLEIQVSNSGASVQARVPIQRVKRSERALWINVLDPGLDLHLWEERICTARAEAESRDCGSLRWIADNGVTAFSVRAARGFEALSQAARANDLLLHPC